MDVYLDMGLLDHIEVPDLFFEPYQMVVPIFPPSTVFKGLLSTVPTSLPVLAVFRELTAIPTGVRC